MKITFNNSDFLNFFNMVSVYKTYVEVADKVDIEPPRSAIDLILYYLTSLIIKNAWYHSTFLDNENLCFAVIQFMLGTAKTQMDEDVITAFNLPGQMLEIDMKKLWNHLLEHGIEI